MISRRTVLKQMAFATGAIALAPSLVSCESSSRPSPLFKNILVTEDQDEMLALISETIIPMPNTAEGKKDNSTHEYTARMIDDCMSKKDQEKWLQGLNQFAELAKTQGKSDFTKMDTASRVKFLIDLDASKEEKEVNFFFKTMKGYTLRGYTTSEYYLTNIRDYKILPGKFKGCVPVSNPS
ncbi:MAG TPA: gluconate 2-dehydrogenase subunit 3 family protein [Chryseolinea sp.]|nr:gluconate 2-dehydrogenase subunit 3 family protein [Chryseolinea sp.]HPH46105.1 gluconate 2-dehydrogenase subunit 3 family protein [Chryseolinea sp.]HPM32082.1 gluconate 2-dehydrogenase subunit 3 family protein [Chryseolinea sp.]